MFLVEDQIVGELDWGLAGSNPYSAPRFHEEPGRADDPMHVSVAHDRHSGILQALRTSRYGSLRSARLRYELAGESD